MTHECNISIDWTLWKYLFLFFFFSLFYFICLLPCLNDFILVMHSFSLDQESECVLSYDRYNAWRRSEIQPRGLNRSKAYRTSFRESRRRVTTSKSSLHLNPSSESVCARKTGIPAAQEYLLNERETTSSLGWFANLVRKPHYYFNSLFNTTVIREKQLSKIIISRLSWIT